MSLKYDEKGLIPAVVQDEKTGAVLMVAYMNEESLQKTIETGKATFYSRSRQSLWTKGETSGNFLDVTGIYVDCDEDTLLVQANPVGPACHTKNDTCFFKKIEQGEVKETDCVNGVKSTMLLKIADVVKHRQVNPKEGSYTNYLLEKGIDKILKKVGEEAAEVIIGAKNGDIDEIRYETADLMYHLSVMLVERGLCWEEVFDELKRRYH